MNIGYYPPSGNGNRYVDDIMESIIMTGVELTPVSIKNIKNKELDNLDAINLNWFEGFSDNLLIRTIKRFLERIEFINYCKRKKIKIIWTVHNKIPHDVKYKVLTKILMKKLAIDSDAIIIHCYETSNVLKELTGINLKDKINYVPHPNYCGAYIDKKQNLKEKFGIKGDELVYLFLGQVRPYKNIELIIEAANINKDKKIKFVIAGKPINKEYAEKIKEKVRLNKNIITVLKFIEDDEMLDFINMSDIIIAPYDINSSLNSGAVILAFSYGKTVLCPNIGTLKDFENKDNFYGYDYSSKEEHLLKLVEEINISYLDWSRDNNILNKKGLILQNEVKLKNNKKEIKRCYKELFSRLLKEKV